VAAVAAAAVLSRAQTQRTHGTRFHRWLVGYGWFVRTIETSPDEGEPRESNGKTPGAHTIALMRNETARSSRDARASRRVVSE
jgi:hypothetical protein